MTYLESRNVRYSESGHTLRLTWQNGSDSPGFSTGWSIDTDLPVHAQLLFDIPQDIDLGVLGQLWPDVESYYLGEVSFIGSGEDARLRSLIRFDMESSGVMIDKTIARMTEAVLSLMSRYEDVTRPAQRVYTNEKRRLFVERNLSGRPVPSPYRKTGGFAAIAGMDSLKEELEEKVLWMMRHKDIAARYRLEQPSGMLLYGPPGCGKTYFAEKFAEESGMKYIMVKPSDLADRYVHGSQTLISDLFKKAQKNAPCVLCFDEFDAFVPRRDSMEATCRTNEVNEFLTQMNNAGERGIFIIGTTNNRDAIDPAVLRSGRLDIQVEVKAPDAESRKALFIHHLAERPLDPRIDYDELAAMTEGYSSSDIVIIVKTAAIKAARREVLIGQEHLRCAIAATRSSIAPEKAITRVGFRTALRVGA